MVPVGAGSPTEAAPVVHLSWPCSHRRHAVVSGDFSGTDAGGDAPARAELEGSAMKSPISLAVLLERFFTQRLMQQRQASPYTINSYRDTFCQFLKFSEQRLKQAPSRLSFHQIDAPLITAFLDDLEKQSGISSRSRNLRLTALRSFFRFAAFEAPAHSAQIQRVLAIPSKRFTRTLVEFLTRAEVDTLLAAPDQNTWIGRRDHAFILLAVQTGLRLSIQPVKQMQADEGEAAATSDAVVINSRAYVCVWRDCQYVHRLSVRAGVRQLAGSEHRTFSASA